MALGVVILFAIMCFAVVEAIDYIADALAREREYQCVPVTRSVCVNGRTHITVKYMKRDNS